MKLFKASAFLSIIAIAVTVSAQDSQDMESSIPHERATAAKLTLVGTHDLISEGTLLDTWTCKKAGIFDTKLPDWIPTTFKCKSASGKVALKGFNFNESIGQVQLFIGNEKGQGNSVPLNQLSAHEISYGIIGKTTASTVRRARAGSSFID